MNTIAYSSPFVPREWIEAHGLRPHRLRLRVTDVPTPRGVCPFAAATVNDATTQDAIVLTTVCDQMRYAASAIAIHGNRPVFLLNVPSTWQTAAARNLYRSELERLGRFLTRHGGKTQASDDLKRIMLTRRRSLCDEGKNQAEKPKNNAVPLAVVGGPFLADEDRFFAVVEQAGGHVTLNATEESERTMPRPFDPIRTAADPLAELADAYFDGIVDPFQRPDSRLYDWLGKELAAKKVQGVLLRRYLWCDLWHAELQRLREWSRLPVLEIDIGPDDTASPNRMQGRIEAFLETLQKIR